jgi:hypothetical protein
MGRWRAGFALFLFAAFLGQAEAQTDAKWQQPGTKAGAWRVGLRTSICLRNPGGEEPDQGFLLCLGLSCPSRDQYELWTLFDGGAWLQGAAKLTSGPHSFTAEMARDELVTADLKIPTSRGTVGISFLQAIRREKHLRIEANDFVGATFPLANFATELNRLKAHCDRM